jgi:hypothetical protein
MLFRYLPVLAVISLFASVASASGAANNTQSPDQYKQYRSWVQQMKSSEQGPFERIRWFCNDGTVLPPKAYACVKHGGGVQHGEYNRQAETLRSKGYWVATLLAGIDAKKVLDSEHFQEMYNQLLIGKFLVIVDDGWILNKAQFYRGAFQEEDERVGARDLLAAMAADAEWIGGRFPALRMGVRLLPHGKDTASAQKVRQMAASLAESDKGFAPLRVKIHGSPDAGDAEDVRAYAEKIKSKEQQAKYLALVDEIDQLYKGVPLPVVLEKNAKIFSGGPWLQKLLRTAANDYAAVDTADNHFAVSAKLLADLRRSITKVRSPEARLRVLDLSMAVESASFSASTELRQGLSNSSRAQRIVWLKSAAEAAYGSGAINGRSLDAVKQSLASLESKSVSLDSYLQNLRYLARVPGWGTQGMRFQFYEAMEKLAQIEPLSMHFIQDQLRGSALLFFSKTLDSLVRDGNQMAGVKHKLFGKEIGVGFHALNPGLARGILHTDTNMDNMKAIRPDGIYVLPETISDLPPLAGIITAGEGNPLSHVQLLARNLGIPNVTVNATLLPDLSPHNGETVIMAVSPAGLVELEKDSPEWQKIFEQSKGVGDAVIRPDLEKLNLSIREFIDLDTLRAADSGRIVGPKAAKLGELHHAFPDRVSKGVAIPFGVFREVVLDKPYKGSKQTVFDWMVDQYAKIHALKEGSEQRVQTAETFRAELYDIIMNADLGDKFRRNLKAAITKTFGTTDLGVFVRSDTNVEDLAGFTGAGLNLTLPNVIGFDGVVNAINNVWASPFTARAFAWRQSHMEQPQHVYPAVLLLRSVANDKSGVMVTADIETGDRDTISVAVNEGVGGAVDGQSAESLRISTKVGSIRLLATATAPWRRLPVAEGGIVKLPASGSDWVLKPDEIKQLVKFAKELPTKFPPITDDKGNSSPADIEFGFLDGKLHLFQLRPFLQSSKAQGSDYLANMDKSLEGNMNQTVDMMGVPGK